MDSPFINQLFLLSPFDKEKVKIMSETATLETLYKKRTELENQWSSKLQKKKTLEDDIKALEEKVQAQLEQKIKSEDTALETLESKKKELEKRLEELQEKQETPQSIEEPTTIPAANPEPVPEQPIEVAATANFDNQWSNEDTRDKHKEEKKRRWM